MLDLVVSTMIFLVIVMMFVWGWNETQIAVWGFESVQDYRDKALDVTEVLLHTKGDPVYWENLENVSVGVASIGLVSEPSVLSANKLERFGEIPYHDSRKIMGLAKEGYYIEIMDEENDTLYSFGLENNAKSAVSRFAILENKTVTFELRLFEQ